MKLYDLVRWWFVCELMKKEAFVCRIRDKVRAFGMCLEFLEDCDSLVFDFEMDD